jgi:hypothetical protein
MIMDKSIDKDSLLEIISSLSIKIDDAACLIKSLGVEESNNGFGSVFLKPFGDNFKRIIIQQKNNSVESITFFGEFNISFIDLVDLFGEFEKKYSHNEDHYYYHFVNNNRHPLGNISIRTYSSNDVSKINNWDLKNIAILWLPE